MKSTLNAIAKRYPRILSGIWFMSSAAMLVFPLASMSLLMMAIETVAGKAIISYLPFLCAIFILPLLSAFIIGTLTGPIILRISYGWAAVVGGLTGFGTFLFWMALLEILPKIFWMLTEAEKGSGVGGDVPAAAEVVAYFVFLPLAGILSLLFGAASGVLLHCTKSQNY